MARMILVGVLAALLGTAASQEITTNSQGEAILRMPDGSWRYLEAGDTIYANEEPQWGKQHYLHYLTAALMFEEEVRDVVDKSEEKMYTLENKRSAAKKDGDKYALREAELDIKEHMESLDKQRSQLRYVRGLVKEIEKIGTKGKFERLSKISIPLRYLNATRDSYLDGLPHQSYTMSDKSAEGQIARPRKKEKRLITEPVGKRHAARKEATSVDGNTRRQRENNKASSWSYQIPLSAAVDRSDPDCLFAFNGVEEFSGNVRRDLVAETLFTHTDPRLRPYLKGRDYIVADGYLSSVSGGYRYLTLTVRVASKNAKREYGVLKPSSLMKMTLLDGSTVSLFSQNGSSGTLDPMTGDVTFKMSYGIDYQKAKLLRKVEIDQVRMVWSSGYEDYVVFNVDFFMRQLACLNSKFN